LSVKKLMKSMLVVFIVLSVGVLIYKEFTSESGTNTDPVTVLQAEKKAESIEPAPDPATRPSEVAVMKQKEQIPPSRPEVKSVDSKVIAYYFHGNVRCYTCRNIEQYSHDAVNNYFGKEIADGKLEFMPVNVDEADNRHYIQDYQLVTRSLVLSLVSGGKETKWKNLTDVWKLVRDKEKFFQYVKDEVELFLQETR
jgi:hypothetical protein